ncbi:MAG TPA: hypothetical protein DCM86_18170 [Verrucomicrobiales bacterium]|nr:hypothetical protein [Verrucomicrobiales bacterium]
MAADTPPDAEYLKLPPVAEIVGTLAHVETRTDRPQILLLTAKATAGLLGNRTVGVVTGAGEAVGNLGKTLGGLFSGQKPATSTNAPGTSTNKPAGFNPLNLFKKK